jgi:hypothetical protein
MPIKLVEHGEDAVEFVDPKKPKTKKVESVLEKSERLTQLIWKGCPFLEKSRQVTSSGKVYICTFWDKKSHSKNASEVFSCRDCPKYEVHLARKG